MAEVRDLGASGGLGEYSFHGVRRNFLGDRNVLCCDGMRIAWVYPFVKVVQLRFVHFNMSILCL